MWECEKCANKNSFVSNVCLICNTPLSKDKIDEIVSEEIMFQKEKYKKFILNNLDTVVIKSKVINNVLFFSIILIMACTLYLGRDMYKSQSNIASVVTKLDVGARISNIQFKKLNKGNEINTAKKKIVAQAGLVITKKNIQEKTSHVLNKIKEVEDKLWDRH